MARNKRVNPPWLSLSLCLCLASCAQRPWTSSSNSPSSEQALAHIWSFPTPTPAPIPTLTSPAPETQPPPVAWARTPKTTPALVSHAKTPQDYRADAARHLYETYQQRIYPGKLPPMLKAVGVVEVAVNSQGQVDGIVWLRAPQHVPEVMREIEQALRQAAPYPAPVHMKQVKYIDTWLWHASGRFQLDTLTEGQY